ncbi:MAG: hypothetical protein NC187_07695 [Candidatus Amulumruptor caecigallinarius]|nr:hypothetical protein [Candidatus Amulumruptor caecigallinarius]MCM1397352.1 hypothetical protein [Candidatus Amulumruptor caecigallinarius]MCM1453585.1 hypothetical protein [bacterium]
MFGIKKRMRACSQSVHSKLSECASSCWVRLKTRVGFDRRVEQANMWAEAHPRRFFGYVMGVSAVILATSLAMGLCGNPDEPEVSAPSVTHSQNVGIDRVIGGMRAIHANNDIISTTVLKARMTGDQLRYEIDSLRALPVKTAEDSAAIMRKGKQLEGIISFFEQHEKD